MSWQGVLEKVKHWASTALAYLVLVVLALACWAFRIDLGDDREASE